MTFNEQRWRFGVTWWHFWVFFPASIGGLVAVQMH